MNARDQNALAIVPAQSVVQRIESVDWDRLAKDLDVDGSAIIERMLAPAECNALSALYPIDDLFRSRMQVAILLSEPVRDFTGGEFVMTEQRPRMQSRPAVVPLRQGDAVVFAVHHRPVQGTRGSYRVNLRHGVSRVRSGHRHTAGIIFHDAA